MKKAISWTLTTVITIAIGLCMLGASAYFLGWCIGSLIVLFPTAAKAVGYLLGAAICGFFCIWGINMIGLGAVRAWINRGDLRG
jgi:hypothetical protein